MAPELLKSFLVGLGFGVDDASLAKFNKAIASATLKVTALYGSVKLAAAGILYGISKISEGFEQLGYEYKIIAPAINKAIMLRQEMLKAYAAAGVNLTKVVQASVKLNLSLTKTKYAFEAIYRSVASRFFDMLTKQSDLFRAKIYANMPKIQAALEKFVKFVFKALEATTALGIRLWSILTRVYDFLISLDRATDGWSTIVLGLVAAWEALNLSFLATPLGMLLTGLLAILALYDDFKTFQEGGKSFFDWSSFIPVIDAVKEALSSLFSVIQANFDILANLVLSIYQLVHGDYSGAFDSLKDAFSGVFSYVEKFIDLLHKAADAVLHLGAWGARNLGFNDAARFLENSAGPQNPAPLGANPGILGQMNQNHTLQQQTNIYTQPGADAQAIGKISSSDTKQNFNMVRNMQGAVQPGPPK